MKVTKEDTEIKPTSVLLDTCVLIPFFTDWQDDQAEVETAIKKLLLFGAKPQVHLSVIYELRRALKNNFRKLLTDDDVIEKVHEHLPTPILDIIKVPNKVRRHLHYEKKELGYTDSPLGSLSLVDRQLAIHSIIDDIPVYTKDKRILSIVGRKSVHLELPSPFNDTSLSAVQMADLIALSPPLARLLRQAIQHLQAQLAQSDEFEQARKSQALTIAELDRQLYEVVRENRDLRKLAKPDFAEAAAWTTLELILGFLPIPIPTTPISTFIQSKRVSNVLNKTGRKEPNNGIECDK